MIKAAKYTYRGMNQDFSKSKHPGEFYYSGKNIRILSTNSQSSLSVTNERGNEKILELPDISIDIGLQVITYGDKTLSYDNTEITQQINNSLLPSTSNSQVIIGHAITRNSIILFSTDDLGMDCIWEINEMLNGIYELVLLYVRNLNFSTNNPIQALFNYENDIIQKVYWVDGSNQLRFLNTKHSIENEDLEELIDINSNTINFVSNFDLTQPIIDDILYGGIHTSGVIQYAYNLYRLNGSQTTISPLSELVSLDKGDNLGGGDLNEVVGATPIVRISNIDPEYTHIKIYAIKYTSFNQVPQISLIENREIGTINEVIYFDDGAIIEELTLEEFIFLGSNPIIPKHIESKDSRLFSANIEENQFDVDLDCRAYSFLSSSSTAYVLNNVVSIPGTLGIPNATPEVGGDFTLIPADFSLDKKYDSVNPNYDAYRFKKNSTVEGGTGKYIEYDITPTSLSVEDSRKHRFFKDREVYRIGIQFYNRLGQISFPKWIADFKAGFNNLNGTYNTISVKLTPEFYIWLNDNSNFNSENDKPIGYKIIRAERNLNDRSVLYQGTISPMMFQVKGAEATDYSRFYDVSEREAFQDQANIVKMPSWAIRNFSNTMRLPNFSDSKPSSGRIIQNKHLAWLNDGSVTAQNSLSSTDSGEIHTVTDPSNKVSQTFLHTKMMQFYSPDIMFDFSNVKNGLQLRVNGIILRSHEYIETQETEITSGLEKYGGKFEFFPTRQYISNNTFDNTTQTPESERNPRYIGPSGDDGTTDLFQMYRGYSTFVKSVNSVVREIYGKPEIMVEGQGTSEYNGDPRYKYSNNLASFISDGEDDCDECPALVSINSIGSKSLMLMLGSASQNTSTRDSIESLFAFTGIGSIFGDGILSIDIIIPNKNLYLGNLYGGNTYEDKKRNSYIQIGSYTDINTNEVNILSPGDTFLNDFQFMRIGKSSISTLDSRIPQITEIVSFPVETVVDLNNRNDLSIFDWDNTFQPSFERYHNYNRVYSQLSNLIINSGEGSLFKEIKQFDTRVLASKLKIPGETIDSWTDLLLNEVQDLDGKYGPINSLISFRDNIFALQDEGVALLSINPRIQVQGSDGVSVELGKGSVLYDYNYVSTKSGTVNKWSVVSSPSGFYYFDLINRSWNKFAGEIKGLTDTRGLHNYFNNNIDYNILKEDNPIKGKGVVGGYDLLNNEAFLTVLNNATTNENAEFTLAYNEMTDSFTSFYDYKPSRYISKGFKMITTNPTNNKLYEHGVGDYNKFYDVYYPSKIVLMINPEADLDCVFNNIQYKSEIYINDIDISNKSLTSIRAYNEYQDSGKIPLIIHKNTRRKFRNWMAEIPRNKNSKDRIRNPWIFLELELDNTSNYKMILHDIILYYSV